eukprot:362078-Chlamydomonas_euryale.AAC.4
MEAGVKQCMHAPATRACGSVGQRMRVHWPARAGPRARACGSIGQRVRVQGPARAGPRASVNTATSTTQQQHHRHYHDAMDCKEATLHCVLNAPCLHVLGPMPLTTLAKAPTRGVQRHQPEGYRGTNQRGTEAPTRGVQRHQAHKNGGTEHRATQAQSIEGQRYRDAEHRETEQRETPSIEIQSRERHRA